MLSAYSSSHLFLWVGFKFRLEKGTQPLSPSSPQMLNGCHWNHTAVRDAPTPTPDCLPGPSKAQGPADLGTCVRRCVTWGTDDRSPQTGCRSMSHDLSCKARPPGCGAGSGRSAGPSSAPTRGVSLPRCLRPPLYTRSTRRLCTPDLGGVQPGTETTGGGGAGGRVPSGPRPRFRPGPE